MDTIIAFTIIFIIIIISVIAIILYCNYGNKKYQWNTFSLDGRKYSIGSYADNSTGYYHFKIKDENDNTVFSKVYCMTSTNMYQYCINSFYKKLKEKKPDEILNQHKEEWIRINNDNS